MCPKGKEGLSGPMVCLLLSQGDTDTRTQEFWYPFWDLRPKCPDLLSALQA